MMEWTPAAASAASRLPRDREPRVEIDARIESGPIIQVQNLSKSYLTARGELTLFEDLNLTVEAGEMVAIVGQSGAGKSTLLHILGALDTPSAGTVYCASTNVAELAPGRQRPFAIAKSATCGSSITCCRSLRRWKTWLCRCWPAAQQKMGHRATIPRRRVEAEAMGMAANWLKEVGLEDRSTHRPGELSGGEQQRVALARALVNKPRLLLADEPTGDLDETTAGLVFNLIDRLHASHGLTSILVTHNMDLAARCTRVLRLEGGRLIPLPAASTPSPH